MRSPRYAANIYYLFERLELPGLVLIDHGGAKTLPRLRGRILRSPPRLASPIQ